ncbi:hypothetical protein ABD80_10710 [Bacillus atrophaeus]|uniref:Uncharacterized protein n=2 Tax=Bacillus atrophaeus TaxID=1452 RepID=A0ABN3ZDC4_BACA1|nr:hypothetical protein BATR1942_16010 [Bacillus atrophaeus 1942]AMR61192.1 hypothetical protein A1D11_01725 [Bacillus subtilis subsp. globigii]EIM11197.1 hypothetical protein UY9_08840 [Bacillus atrophaeus C89]MBG9760278.1 hypothetical protein [Bacillus atrophaeus]MDR4398487.1 hypothetical protein [Bacillus atrophaeus]
MVNIMEHGIRFTVENPEIGELLHRLLVNRELDEWYKNKCAEKIQVPQEFNQIKHLKKIEVRDMNNPSGDITIHLLDLSGENGFHLEQQINIKISKLVPVYVLDYSYSLRHELIDGAYDIVGTAESLELIQGTNFISKVMQEKGFIELSYLYDYYDTVYEWSDLPNIQPFNRRLTLGDALFTDVLELL